MRRVQDNNPPEEEARDATRHGPPVDPLRPRVRGHIFGIGGRCVLNLHRRRSLFSSCVHLLVIRPPTNCSSNLTLSLTLFSPPLPTPSLRLARATARPPPRRRFDRKRTRRGVHVRGVVGAGRAVSGRLGEGQVRHPKYGGDLFSDGVRRFRANSD